jgi:peptidoglycan-associated lipoprotein
VIQPVRLPNDTTSEKGEYTLKLHRQQYLASIAVLALVAFSVGCKKKAAAPPPPPPPTINAPQPTASISAAPSSVNSGEGVALTWHTTDADDVSIDGIGKVPSSGTQTVNPTASTNYHLVARGAGGSADATTRVTVNAAIAPMADNSNGLSDDAAFRQNVQDVFFDYDSYDISSDNQSVILKDAAYLTAHSNIKVVIGGYCDERGSTEYNLALGENRASAVKKALVAAGVGADRIRTVSYGKEKQFCSDHSESCWQQNRRGQFSIDR